MPTYTAHFQFILRIPVDVVSLNMPGLKITSGNSVTLVTSIVPMYEGAKIVALSVEAAYSSPQLTHSVIAGSGPEAGIALLTGEGIIGNVWAVVANQIAPLLYQMSGITMQEHVYWDVLPDWNNYVKDFWWQMPDGSRAPPFPDHHKMGPFRVLRDLSSSGKRALTESDWKEIEQAFAGTGNGAPLWRLLLSEAHRDRLTDRRNVVLRCAMALDVGISSFLPSTDEFNLEVLRGERRSYNTPDMRLTEPRLYETIARLWYTRHAIMHRGEFHVYDKRPGPGVVPLQILRDDDVDQFLCAVPKAIDFVLQNPP